jgi:pimeloyl-ACP methyl ester carboxylesterase
MPALRSLAITACTRQPDHKTTQRKSELIQNVSLGTIANAESHPGVITSVTLPSLLLVHGAWHRPEHFRLLVDELAGLDVHTVALPSTGDDPASLGDMYADAKVIAEAVEAIDGPVVVVAHSYGGVPTTHALSGMSNVVRIVYVCAFVLEDGESLASVAGPLLDNWIIHEIDGVPRYIEHKLPVESFYGDVPTALAEWAVEILGYSSIAPGSQPLTEAAWKTIPSTYIICEADNAIPPAMQEEFAKHAKCIRRINASHSPFLSQPAALARILREELEAV